MFQAVLPIISCSSHIDNFYVIVNGAPLQVDGFRGDLITKFGKNTWCRAVSPSTFVVLISAPCCNNRYTSSLSPAAHAARNTHPDEKFILRDFCFGDTGSLFVSESSHLLSCSALLKRAEFERVSMDMII